MPMTIAETGRQSSLTKRRTLWIDGTAGGSTRSTHGIVVSAPGQMFTRCCVVELRWVSCQELGDAGIAGCPNRCKCTFRPSDQRERREAIDVAGMNDPIDPRTHEWS